MAGENRSGRGEGQPGFAPLYAEDVPPRPMPTTLRILGPLVALATHAFQDLRVTGLSNLAESGPAIIVSNHSAYCDPLTIGVPLFQKGIAPRFGARADLFTIPVLGFLLKTAGQIPIHRRGDISELSRDSSVALGLDDLSATLDDGGCVCLFAEGTFTFDPDGWAMKAKTGAARLALAHPQVPVIPVAHWGNERLFDPWTARPNLRLFGRRTTTAHVRIGKPVDLEAFRSRPVTKELLDEMTAKIMDAVNDELEIIRRADPASCDIRRRDHLWSKDGDGWPVRAHDEIFNTRLHDRVAARLARRDNRKR